MKNRRFRIKTIQLKWLCEELWVLSDCLSREDRIKIEEKHPGSMRVSCDLYECGLCFNIEGDVVM